ncbi:MAG: hypothetical protein ACQEWF_23235 [Bacillota bacterium]
MTKNIFLGVLAALAFILFAIGMNQSSNSLWMAIAIVGFVAFMLLIYRLVFINFKPK